MYKIEEETRPYKKRLITSIYDYDDANFYQPSIFMLPEEIILMILSFIPNTLSNWCNVMLACKAFLYFGKIAFSPAVGDNNAIKKATVDGNYFLVQSLLRDKRVDPTIGHNFPLFCAAYNGHVEILKELLQDPRVDPWNSTLNPFSMVTETKNRMDVIRAFLHDHRVDPSRFNNYALHSACIGKDYEMVAELLKHRQVSSSIDALQFIIHYDLPKSINTSLVKQYIENKYRTLTS